MKSFVTLLLVAAVSSRSLIQIGNTFAGGMNGDEDMSADIVAMEQKEHYNMDMRTNSTSMSMLVQNASSKMFNAFDLPNCTGKDADVALQRDLSNKSLATCKYGDPDA